MKTAEDFIYQFKPLETSNGNDAFTAEDAIKAMKLYANKKLDEAAENADIDIINDEQGFGASVNKESILSLKDKI